MTFSRTEKQTTPIGQEIEVDWHLATPGEAEAELRKNGEIGIVKDGIYYIVNLENGKPDGLVQVWNETLDEEHPTKVSHLSEFFDGQIEFCYILTE